MVPLWAAIGVMMALYWRDAQVRGIGKVIDLGLSDGLFRQIEQQIIVPDQLGQIVGRTGNKRGRAAFVESFEAKHGKYFSFAAATEHIGGDILRSMGIENDSRFNAWDRCKLSRALLAIRDDVHEHIHEHF